MALVDLADWINEYSSPRYVWYIKRLSANDTQATRGHQAGPYIPKEFLFRIFPELHQPETENPRVTFDLYIHSHNDARPITAIWYNNKTRNETRITGFGGSSSAFLDTENTGALAVIAFKIDAEENSYEAHAWVCEHPTEEDLVEERVGLVEPGKARYWTIDDVAGTSIIDNQSNVLRPCYLASDEIPALWIQTFPTGMQIVRKTLELCPDNNGMSADERLLRRRKCEFEIFQSVEEAIELETIRQGFNSVNDFISHAQRILQRRKARAGRSLELHTREIFIEETLEENINFDYQAESDRGQRPDFLFPSKAAYKNPDFPANKLKMLAVKTTCKDRWRQILQEASRIPEKHLLTLQEGVSEGQFREMTEAGVRLVVPNPLKNSYPESIRPHLISFESFIGDVRLLSI